MRYPNLIFDLYGTLVDIHTEESPEVWEKTALFFGYHGAHCTGHLLRAAFEEELRRREAKYGQSYECYPDIPFEAVFAAVLAQMGVRARRRALAVQAATLFRISSTQYLRLYDGVHAALEALRRQGCRLWLLSNAQAVFTRRELRALELENAFDGVYLSSDYGCRKPDGRFFRALLEGEGLEPGSCLMIGNDRETDIAGAAAVGIATLYLHTPLTPASQAPADPASPWEAEGADWSTLPQRILCL